MSDYLYVFKVRYANPGQRTPVEKVKARETDTAQTTGPKARKSGTRVILTKDELVSAIDGGTEARTLYRFRKGEPWRMGPLIRVFRRDGESFVRTDADKVKADNLDKLEEF